MIDQLEFSARREVVLASACQAHSARHGWIQYYGQSAKIFSRICQGQHGCRSVSSIRFSLSGIRIVQSPAIRVLDILACLVSRACYIKIAMGCLVRVSLSVARRFIARSSARRQRYRSTGRPKMPGCDRHLLHIQGF